LNLIKDPEKTTTIRERKGLEIRIAIVILVVIQVIIVILVVVLGLLGPFPEPSLLKILLTIRVSRKGIILVILSALSIINKLRKT
jgi:hypothetical protein